MSRWAQGGTVVLMSFPRVSGDEPEGLDIVDVVAQFSPRERG